MANNETTDPRRGWPPCDSCVERNETETCDWDAVGRKRCSNCDRHAADDPNHRCTFLSDAHIEKELLQRHGEDLSAYLKTSLDDLYDLAKERGRAEERERLTSRLDDAYESGARAAYREINHLYETGVRDALQAGRRAGIKAGRKIISAKISEAFDSATDRVPVSYPEANERDAIRSAEQGVKEMIQGMTDNLFCLPEGSSYLEAYKDGAWSAAMRGLAAESQGPRSLKAGGHPDDVTRADIRIQVINERLKAIRDARDAWLYQDPEEDPVRKVESLEETIIESSSSHGRELQFPATSTLPVESSRRSRSRTRSRSPERRPECREREDLRAYRDREPALIHEEDDSEPVYADALEFQGRSE